MLPLAGLEHLSYHTMLTANAWVIRIWADARFFVRVEDEMFHGRFVSRESNPQNLRTFLVMRHFSCRAFHKVTARALPNRSNQSLATVADGVAMLDRSSW